MATAVILCIAFWILHYAIPDDSESPFIADIVGIPTDLIMELIKKIKPNVTSLMSKIMKKLKPSADNAPITKLWIKDIMKNPKL